MREWPDKPMRYALPLVEAHLNVHQIPEDKKRKWPPAKPVRNHDSHAARISLGRTGFAMPDDKHGGPTELVRGDDPVPIYPVHQDLADDQTQEGTEVCGYHPEGNGARRLAQKTADSHRRHIARSNE